jgi:fructose/tagatose bisphosphate aldolase
VMCDASERPFEENIRMTAEFVDKVRGRLVVEGAVDEIFESGGKGEKNEPTTPEQAERFLRETGVDIIVPNVGTEHRATADQIVYRGDRAKEISAAVGNILCLHGTSSVKPENLSSLPSDGFVKINVYTTLAVYGGQSLTRCALDNLGNIFTRDQLTELVGQGVLGGAVLLPDYHNTRGAIKPKLEWVTNPSRRDAWFSAVRDRCMDFLRVFNYVNYAA